MSKRSTIVASDDLDPGQFYAVYGFKGCDEPCPIAGKAFKLTAIELPFVVGRLVECPHHPPVTLDTRMLDLMRVSEEFVKAQTS